MSRGAPCATNAQLPEVAALVGPTQAARVAAAVHMPSAIARRIGGLLRDAHEDGRLDPLAFSGAEQQRTTLMDHVGECERILATPLPRAFSIEIRRSIVLFLLTLTFALLSKELGWVTLLLLVLVAYAILSLDLIGSALQNPFAIDNLGALPLDDICRTLEEELLGLLVEERHLAEPEEEIPALSPRPDADGEPGQGRPSFHPSPSFGPREYGRPTRQDSQPADRLLLISRRLSVVDRKSPNI